MPKFIYTIIFIILINLLGIYLLITNTTPENTPNKIFFSFLISLIVTFLIPLMQTLIKFSSRNKEDLNVSFKKFFSQNLIFSIYFGIAVFIKIQFDLDFKIFVILILLFFITKFFLPKVQKSRKKLKY